MSLKFLIVFPFFLFLFSGRSNQNYVIEIGDYKISEKLFQRYVSKQIINNNITNRVNFENWLNHFINERILISEAIRLQIDTCSEFQTQFSNIINQFVVGRGGPVFQKVVSQDTQIDQGYYNRACKIINNSYYISYLKIPCDILSDTIKTTLLKKVVASKSLEQIIKKYHAKLKKEHFFYTSLKLIEFQEELVNLHSDNRYFFMSHDNLINIFRLDSVTTVENYDVTRNQAKILKRLKRYKEELALKKFSNNIITNSKITVNLSNANSLLLTLLNKDLINAQYTFEQATELLKSDLFTYYQLDESKIVDVSGFIEYYNKLLVKTKIYDLEKLVLYINDYVLSKYFQYYFDINGLAKDENFVINSNYLKERLLLSLIEKKIFKNIKIDEIKYELLDNDLKEKKLEIISDFIKEFKSRNKIINRVTIDKYLKKKVG